MIELPVLEGLIMLYFFFQYVSSTLETITVSTQTDTLIEDIPKTIRSLTSIQSDVLPATIPPPPPPPPPPLPVVKIKPSLLPVRKKQQATVRNII